VQLSRRRRDNRPDVDQRGTARRAGRCQPVGVKELRGGRKPRALPWAVEYDPLGVGAGDAVVSSARRRAVGHIARHDRHGAPRRDGCLNVRSTVQPQRGTIPQRRAQPWTGKRASNPPQAPTGRDGQRETSQRAAQGDLVRSKLASLRSKSPHVDGQRESGPCHRLARRSVTLVATGESPPTPYASRTLPPPAPRRRERRRGAGGGLRQSGKGGEGSGDFSCQRESPSGKPMASGRGLSQR